LLVIDEAALVPDEMVAAVRPMLAVSGGRLVALSTPKGKRGWFYEAWERGRTWEKYRITADQVRRITPAFLKEEREELGGRWFRQEYFCSFEDMLGAVFSGGDIEEAFRPSGLDPLFAQGDPEEEADLGDAGLQPLFGAGGFDE